ncbi:MAG: ABC transporter permease subunit [Bacteroidetes bacterium]|nr:ABC transporter permease subunit [Bacteroidota bacterium]
MKNILTIFKKELRSYFNSPVAYIVIVVFLIITGWFFTSNLFIGGVVTMRNVFDIIPFIFLFFIPAISMRTFSEEKKSGTIELLLTKPISDMDIVLGKFFSTLTLTAIAIAFTLFYVVSLTFLGPIDTGSIIGAYIGLLLMSGVYIGIGIFASSLTENQVVAFIISFLIVFGLFLLNKVLVFLPTELASILEYISVDYHFSNIARGVIDSRDIIYYLSGITIFLLLTRTSLESRRWS